MIWLVDALKAIDCPVTRETQACFCLDTIVALHLEISSSLSYT